MKKHGIVYLIGAGPGDVGLITLKGRDILKIADCVLYDKLANPELLSFVNENAEKIFVGKEAGLHHVSQDETIKILIKKASEGKIVARLKGGDPLIFGRGSEEAIALREQKIPFEIIPGVSAAIGATAYSGIPLTHRNLVTQCIFVTAHESPDKDSSQVDWKSIAQLKNTTIAIYMGVKMLPKVVAELLEGGLNDNTPAALIQNGTLPSQRTITTTLSELPQAALNHDIKPPVLTIIGQTVELRNSLSWFENRPLWQKRIVITRASDQSSQLHNLLVELGAWVINMPMIATRLKMPKIDIEEILNQNFDWVIFTSQNGVRKFFELINMKGLDARVLHGKSIAVIGEGTKSELVKRSIIPDFVPMIFTSEYLAEELLRNNKLIKNNVLRVKGDFSLDILSDTLRNNGVNVTQYEVYEITKTNVGSETIEDIIKNGSDAVLFTSSSTVNNFFDAVGAEDAKQILDNTKVISIGPVTSKTLAVKGINNYITSKRHDLIGLIDTVKDVLK